MNRFAWRCLILVFPSLLGSAVWAQSPAAHVEEATTRKATAAGVAPVAHQQLFGTIPVSTRSEEARKLVELSLDKYENHITEAALAYASQAVQKDPRFALGHAVLSLVSMSTIPDAAALAKAKALASHATPDEQLLVRWMTSIGEHNVLPAISSMNDLLMRYPNNKTVIYLLADWLYYQQDYERSLKMLETVHKLDPDFPPALNLLGYAYIQTGKPNPAKAIASLKHYAEVQPNSPNPEDSLGEILRISGDDQGSLEHYARATQIDPTFISSHWGLGDTSALMGNYGLARAEYDNAIAVANNLRDRSHAEFQKALVYFWEGQQAKGRKALDSLYEKAQERKEPYSVSEIGLGRAMLAANSSTEFQQLHTLESWLQKPVAGMADIDRDNALATVLREHARVAAAHEDTADAEAAIARLEQLVSQSRDLMIANSYSTAHGYLMFAQGNFDKAWEDLSADSRSVLAMDELADAQASLGDTEAAAATQERVKYMRAPSVEWYLLTHTAATAANRE